MNDPIMKRRKKKFRPTQIIPPAGGWEPSTWYLVEVSYRAGNPIHRNLFYSGFLSTRDIGFGKEIIPGGYNGLLPLNFANSEPATPITGVRYCKVITKLFSTKEADNFNADVAAAQKAFTELEKLQT